MTGSRKLLEKGRKILVEANGFSENLINLPKRNEASAAKYFQDLQSAYYDFAGQGRQVVEG